MKFGFRVPSVQKRFAARTSWKRYARHSVGIKMPRGLGWISNPKKASYNRIYNRVSFDVFKLSGKGGVGSSPQTSGNDTPKMPFEVIRGDYWKLTNFFAVRFAVAFLALCGIGIILCISIIAAPLGILCFFLAILDFLFGYPLALLLACGLHHKPLAGFTEPPALPAQSAEPPPLPHERPSL